MAAIIFQVALFKNITYRQEVIDALKKKYVAGEVNFEDTVQQ
jgi:hypothetical protein